MWCELSTVAEIRTGATACARYEGDGEALAQGLAVTYHSTWKCS